MFPSSIRDLDEAADEEEAADAAVADAIDVEDLEAETAVVVEAAERSVADLRRLLASCS